MKIIFSILLLTLVRALSIWDRNNILEYKGNLKGAFHLLYDYPAQRKDFEVAAS